MDRADVTRKIWVEPKLVVHGDVEKITTMPPAFEKVHGPSDGLAFQAPRLKNVS